MEALELTHNKKLRSSTTGKLQIPGKCNLTKTLNCCFYLIN